MNLRGKKERSNARGESRLRQTVNEIGIKVAQQLLEEGTQKGHTARGEMKNCQSLQPRKYNFEAKLFALTNQSVGVHKAYQVHFLQS